nr:putative signal peptide and transmembrane prediction protein [uncultured bacterium]
MTFLGKILVVTIVIFSLIFMAFAGAVYERQVTFKTKFTASEKKLAEANNKLQAETEAHESDKVKDAERVRNAETASSTAQAELDGVKAQLLDEQTRHKTTTVERTNFQTQAEVASRVAQIRTEEAEKQLGVNKKLLQEQDENISLIAQLRKQLYDLTRMDKERQGKHNVMLEQLAQATEKNKKYEDIIKKFNYDAGPDALAVKQVPPPDIEGVVQNTRKDSANGTEYIEISLGSDDGLAVGHIMVVSRGSKYMGQIKLVNVSPDNAVGTVIKSSKNGIIEAGDHVSTKL